VIAFSKLFESLIHKEQLGDEMTFNGIVASLLSPVQITCGLLPDKTSWSSGALKYMLALMPIPDIFNLPLAFFFFTFTSLSRLIKEIYIGIYE
jgi:hypothetical protein